MNRKPCCYVSVFKGRVKLTTSIGKCWSVRKMQIPIDSVRYYAVKVRHSVTIWRTCCHGYFARDEVILTKEKWFGSLLLLCVVNCLYLTIKTDNGQSFNNMNIGSKNRIGFNPDLRYAVRKCFEINNKCCTFAIIISLF